MKIEYNQYNERTVTNEYAGYPCENGIDPKGTSNRKPWFSSKLDNNLQDIIVFKGELSDFTRIQYFMINWLVAPEFIGMEYSPDHKYWVQDRDLTPTKSINNFNNMFGFDIAFSQKLDFTEPRWLRAFRLIMKKPLAGNRIGFASIQAFSSHFTAMIRNLKDSSSCLARQNPDYFKPDSSLNMFDCADAISLNDGREVFVISPDFHVRSLLDS